MKTKSVKMAATDFETHENSAQTYENRAFLGANCLEIGVLKLDCRSMFSSVNTGNVLCARLVVECVSLV